MNLPDRLERCVTVIAHSRGRVALELGFGHVRV